MSDVTPQEHELPNIISVDDHVMEPKTLWQEQLPPSLRERGPRVSREKVKLDFSGGHYGFERNVEDGDWCDVWLFEDLATPTGLLHGPAGIPRNEQRNVPAVYEDLRPGTYDQAARGSPCGTPYRRQTRRRGAEDGSTGSSTRGSSRTA